LNDYPPASTAQASPLWIRFVLRRACRQLIPMPRKARKQDEVREVGEIDNVAGDPADESKLKVEQHEADEEHSQPWSCVLSHHYRVDVARRKSGLFIVRVRRMVETVRMTAPTCRTDSSQSAGPRRNSGSGICAKREPQARGTTEQESDGPANYSRSAFSNPGKDRSMQSTGTVSDNRR
jgi:hypothetical protein